MTNSKTSTLLTVVAGAVLFGFAMVLRSAVSGAWLRSLVAAAAFAIIGATLGVVIAKRRSKK
jgi:hypothetical protein